MKMIYNILVLLLFHYLLAHGQELDSSYVLDTPEKAYERAVEYVGKDYLSDNWQETIQVRYEALQDSTTPFLSTLFGDGDVWRVLVKDVLVAKGISRKNAKPEYLRDMEVFLDSSTGKLLKIECFYGDQSYINKYPLSAEEAESQIDGMGHGDKYNFIPESIPNTNFIEALLNCRENIYEANRIVGQYVNFQTHYKMISLDIDTTTPPVQAWIISLIGLNPKHLQHVSNYPEYTRNRIRQIIDASTNRLIISSTVPCIGLNPEDREKMGFKRK